jgi:hypothetical protein
LFGQHPDKEHGVPMMDEKLDKITHGNPGIKPSKTLERREVAPSRYLLKPHAFGSINAFGQ